MPYKLEKPKVTPRKFLPYLGRTMGLEDDRISLNNPSAGFREAKLMK